MYLARKVLRPAGQVITAQDIQNELDAVKTLCRDNLHDNLVHVYGHGGLPEARSQFFIDMELCSFNLRTYIYDPEKCVSDTTLPPGYRVESIPSRSIPANIWDIMKQISEGVAFMHNHNHVHRDIKPENSAFPKFLQF